MRGPLGGLGWRAAHPLPGRTNPYYHFREMGEVSSQPTGNRGGDHGVTGSDDMNCLDEFRRQDILQ